MPNFTTGYLLGSSIMNSTYNMNSTSGNSDTNIKIAICSSISNEHQRMYCLKNLQKDYEKDMDFLCGFEIVLLIVALLFIAYFIITTP